LADKPPPQRWRVEERGGRLIVIDVLTGAPPPTAAERHGARHPHMAAHTPPPAPPPATRAAPATKPEPTAKSVRDRDQQPTPPWRVEPKAPPTSSARPWSSNEAKPRAPSALEDKLRKLVDINEAATPPRPTVPAGGASTAMTTQRWFDAKGPRTLLLSRAAHDRQQKMLMWAIIAVTLFAAAAFLISPVILFIVVFALLRGGREIIAQAGAKWIDSLENQGN
jgi:hypothetical protein